MSTRVAVIGGSGFVGSAVVQRLRNKGADVSVIRAPRFACDPEDVHRCIEQHSVDVEALASQLAECTAVINCAGDPDASSMNIPRLFGANAALPGVIARAAASAGVARFVHVSSAVVQGSIARLDESEATSTTSPYGESKAVGEKLTLGGPSPRSTVIFRPPSVHSPDRRVTRLIRRLATSPLASVMDDGSSPSPQAHISNVADAIATLALTSSNPPRIVIHPSEGWTTGELMRFFGDGREPLHIPQALKPALLQLLRLASHSERLAPNVRRVEMMWCGQDQATSWLTTIGWVPPAGRTQWQEMLDVIDNANNRISHESKDTHE